MIKTVGSYTRIKAEEGNSNTPGTDLKVMTKEKPDSYERAFQLSPSVTPTSPPSAHSHPHSLVSWP